MAETQAGPKKRNVLRIVGYVTLAVVSFVFFLYVHFAVVGDAPAERVLVPRLLDQVEAVRIEYDHDRVEGDLLLGMTLHDVRVFSKVQRGMFAGDANPEPLIELDRIRVGLRPLKLLSGKLGVSIKAKLYNGELKGVVAAGRKSLKLDFVVADIDVAYHSLLPNKFGVNPEGKLVGEVDLLIPMKEVKRGKKVSRSLDMSAAVGVVKLTLEEAGLAESNLMGLQKIAAITFSDAGVDVSFGDGVAEISQLGFEGSDLSVTLTGDLKLKSSFMLSSLDGELSVEMSETFERALDPLFKAGIDAGKQSQGKYKYSLKGPIRSLRPRPVRKSGRKRR